MTNFEASRAYLYILLESMKTNRIIIEIEKAALESVQASQDEALPVSKKFIDYIAGFSNEDPATVDSKTFLEGLSLQDVDAEALIAREDVTTDLSSISGMIRAGLIKLKDTDTEKKGQKIAGKDAILSSIGRFYSEFFTPIRSFIEHSTKIQATSTISRYASIQGWIAARCNAFIEMIDRELENAQNALKLASILPIREPVDKAMGTMEGLKKNVQSVLEQLASIAEQKPVISAVVFESLLATIDPGVQVIMESFDMFDHLCVQVFEDWDSPSFETRYLKLRAAIQGTTLDTKDLTGELLLYFIETEQFTTEIKQSGKEKKELRKKVNQIVREEFISYLQATWPEENKDFLGTLDVEDRLSAILPKLLKHALETEERGLMSFTAETELATGQAKLDDIIAAYRARLTDVAAWCDAMEVLLVGEYKTAVNSLRESLEHQDQEIARFFTKMDFFFHETKSQEEKIKIHDEVKKILATLDVLINEFEGNIGTILNKTYLDFEVLGESVKSFKGKYQDILDQLNATLNRYDAFKLMTTIEEIKQFIEKRNEKINLINNMVLVDLRENVNKITRSMSEITGMLKEGKGFSVERGKLIDAEFEANVAEVNISLNGVISEEIIEDEFMIKKRLSLIEERLSEIDTIKKDLEEKRDKLLFRILKDDDKPKFLEEHKVGECIICYEPITTLDEEVIVCPHCGRIGHYLCLAYWLEKYSLCPVCHGKLIRPDDAGTDYENEFNF
ncbi:MAG TPA: hypothetical protein VKM55_21210 [Candidatus Lokiarchaeia archaeon]|nr:hypothetical protein [Candidatus Lokiarchaeia archaeon]